MAIVPAWLRYIAACGIGIWIPVDLPTFGQAAGSIYLSRPKSMQLPESNNNRFGALTYMQVNVQWECSTFTTPKEKEQALLCR